MDEVWRETFFTDGAWHQKDLTFIRRQQAWFMHVAQGGNIRAMDTEIALTKRMAHLIFAVPDVESVSMGLRWAQFLGMGGSRNLVLAVVRSRLRDFMEDEPFWATVVLFLANQPMLDPGPNVLTIAVDNRRRRVIEFRGKYNMRPNDKQRTAKQRHQTSKPYLHLLRKSPEIMRRWTEREQLRHG